MAHSPAGPPYDGDHDDLAALDFSVAGDAAEEPDLGEVLGAVQAPADDVVEMPMFTVTNPPGTVTVTTYMDGRVHRVELSPAAATMAETVLGEEIVVIADLATQDARSAQYTLMLESMREQGHDNAATRDFLSRDLDLPTPEEAQAARAALFTTRYAGDHD